MTTVFAGQTNDILLPLAQLYHRWFLVSCAANYRGDEDTSHSDLFGRIRDQLVEASSLEDALQRVRALHEHETREDLCERLSQAREIVQMVVHAGAIDPLVAGETDGFRHLCLRCAQLFPPEHNVRFFNPRERRLLLKPEISGRLRSKYTRCQRCFQAISPEKLVWLLAAGTKPHQTGCACGNCNRAGRASLLNVYACDWQTQLPQYPFLVQLEAPSRQQCVDRALTSCWKAGWYVLNQEVLPLPVPPATPDTSPA